MPRLANVIGRTQAASTDGSDRHCNGPAPKRVFFRITPGSFQLVWPNPSTAPTKARAHGWRGRELCAQIDLKTDRRWLCHGWQHSSPHDHHGRAATSAQQLGSWCRRSGWGRRAQRLFEHQQLQQRNQTLAVGCKKPKLRARRKPLGNTCCMSSQRKVAPLTVRCAVFLVLLSRQR